MDMKLLPGGLVTLAVNNNDCIKLYDWQTSIKTSKQYKAIAAVTTQTLAVSYRSGAGIDLIDLSGGILYQLSSKLYPLSMVSRADGFLFMSILSDDSIAKVKLEGGSTIFRHKVEQIEYPTGVAYNMDKSFIVADRDKRTLHLISPDGVWIKKLWTHPGDMEQRNKTLKGILVGVRYLFSTTIDLTN
ncbi:hypothetical protein RRG08_005395 [Elysia crispata]|uniref:Uncharacterized protein n=1 Tax=Elysia crispata TaxID=231223 RepID=A0AAE0XYM2_9GAST|nr:hypothetical protein RRG08_005395 [Elysia crispata]